MSNPVLVHDEGGRGAKGCEPPAKRHQVEEENKSATETVAPEASAAIMIATSIDDDAESLMASIDAMLELGSIPAAVGEDDEISIPAAGTAYAREVGVGSAAGQAEAPPLFVYSSPDYPPALHSAHAYHYTHEGELTLEAALAGAGQGASPGEGQGAPPLAPLGEPPAIDASTMLRELELGFNLRRYEDGGGLQSDPPSVEYSENGATLQSELFELGQAGFAQPSTSGEFPPALEGELTAAALMPEDAPGAEAVPEWSRPIIPDIPVPLSESVACIEAGPAPARPIGEPGPPRARRHMHTVHLYPGGGEGEPHTCYLKTLPQLAFVGAFEEERAPPASHSAMLQELLGAAGEDEGDVPPSPSPSPPPSPAAGSRRALSDGEEPDKENKPDTIAEALRSAVISFADLDAEDAQAQAAEEESEEILPEGEPAAAAIEGMATPLAESAPDAPAELVTVAPVISATSADSAVATSADIPDETGTVAPGKPADESSMLATGDDTLISATVTVAEIAPGAPGEAGPSAPADAAAPAAPAPRKRSGKKLKRKRAATAQPAAAAAAQPAAGPRKAKKPKKQMRPAEKSTSTMVLRSRKQHI